MIDPQAQALKWIKNMEGKQVLGWVAPRESRDSSLLKALFLAILLLHAASTRPLVLQDLKIIDLQMHDYLRVLENAIQFGFPVLLQNVQEYLDPTLNPVLNKSVARIGQSLGFLWAGPRDQPSRTLGWKVGLLDCVPCVRPQGSL